MAKQDSRPVFLNLLQIRFPVTAILSIIHRVMGVILVVALPFLIYLLDLALESEAGYTYAKELISHPFVLFVSVGLVWALTHHLFAGIRFLLLDFEYGVEKSVARISAYVVNFCAVLVTLIYLGSLL